MSYMWRKLERHFLVGNGRVLKLNKMFYFQRNTGRDCGAGPRYCPCHSLSCLMLLHQTAPNPLSSILCLWAIYQCCAVLLLLSVPQLRGHFVSSDHAPMFLFVPSFIQHLPLFSAFSSLQMRPSSPPLYTWPNHSPLSPNSDLSVRPSLPSLPG